MDEMKKAKPQEAEAVPEDKAELLPDEKLEEVTGGASIDHVFDIMQRGEDIPTFG